MPEYISVTEVLSSISEALRPQADQQLVELEELLELRDFQDSKKWNTKDAGTFGILGRAAYIGMYSGIGRKSQASRELEAALNNANVRGECPSLYEFSSTGVARLDPHALQVVKVVLIEFSHEFSIALRAHLSGKSTPLQPAWERASRAEKGTSLRLIAFDKKEITDFLCQNNISHTLDETTCEAPDSSSIIGATTFESPLKQASNGGIFSGSGEAPIPQAEIASVLVHRIGRTKANNFKSLQRTLFQAVIQETPLTDPTVVADHVWVLLLAEAKKTDTERPVFLRKYVKGNRIEYDGQTHSGLNKKALRQNIKRWLESQPPKKVLPLAIASATRLQS